MQICQDNGWSYERDWLRMSRDERALWIAYYSVASYQMEMDREQRQHEANLKAMA